MVLYFYFFRERKKRGRKKNKTKTAGEKKNGVKNGDGNELLRERGTLTSGRHNIVVIVLAVFVDIIMYGMSDKK